jgi:hypothetical protein
MKNINIPNVLILLTLLIINAGCVPATSTNAKTSNKSGVVTSGLTSSLETTPLVKCTLTMSTSSPATDIKMGEYYGFISSWPGRIPPSRKYVWSGTKNGTPVEFFNGFQADPVQLTLNYNQAADAGAYTRKLVIVDNSTGTPFCESNEVNYILKAPVVTPPPPVPVVVTTPPDTSAPPAKCSVTMPYNKTPIGIGETYTFISTWSGASINGAKKYLWSGTKNGTPVVFSNDYQADKIQLTLTHNQAADAGTYTRKLTIVDYYTGKTFCESNEVNYILKAPVVTPPPPVPVVVTTPPDTSAPPAKCSVTMPYNKTPIGIGEYYTFISTWSGASINGAKKYLWSGTKNGTPVVFSNDIQADKIQLTLTHNQASDAGAYTRKLTIVDYYTGKTFCESNEVSYTLKAPAVSIESPPSCSLNMYKSDFVLGETVNIVNFWTGTIPVNRNFIWSGTKNGVPVEFDRSAQMGPSILSLNYTQPSDVGSYTRKLTILDNSTSTKYCESNFVSYTVKAPALVVTPTPAPAPVAVVTPVPTPAPVIAPNPSTDKSIKYFGYWGDGMRGVGNGNYINETSAVSNVHFISANLDGETSDEWITKVTQARNNNGKVILMVEGGLFKWQTLEPAINNTTNIRMLDAKLAGLRDSIIGVYLVDEPYYKNITAKNPLSETQVYNNIKEAATLMKFFFPSAAVILTEAAPAVLDGSVRFPAEVDWIGVNCYSYYTECKTVTDLESLYHKLADNFLPNQKMVFTLDGLWMVKAEATTSATQNAIIKRDQDILRLSTQFNTIAFFPFIWQSNDDMVGTEDMPLVKAYLNKIGSDIKNGTFNPASATTATCIVKDPTCEGVDWVRRDSCGKEIERWKNAPKPYCPAGSGAIPVAPATTATCIVKDPTCEGVDWVRRDSCGKEIERWKNAPKPYCPAGSGVIPVAPATTATCVVKDPTCEGVDWVRRDSCGKEIERWKNAPKPYCPAGSGVIPVAPATTATCVVKDPTCEGVDWVRRDSCGKEIERWRNAPRPYCP